MWAPAHSGGLVSRAEACGVPQGPVCRSALRLQIMTSLPGRLNVSLSQPGQNSSFFQIGFYWREMNRICLIHKLQIVAF